ncbi:MAG: serine hydrolase [Eubacteriales bacterium]|nr:serine hydrolase [Eubacteriales bacterium]
MSKIFLSKLLSLGLLLCFGLGLAGCTSKPVLHSIDYTETRNTEPEETTSAETTEKSASTSASESSSTAETTYDFSKEFKAGLNSHIEVNAKTYPVVENSPELDGLKVLIDQFLKDRGLAGRNDNISIVYEDLDAGLRYSYNPDTRYQAASVIKAAMGMVVAQLTDEGVFPADMAITYVPGDHFSADDLDTSSLGKLVPIWNLVDNAIINSNNAATSAIFAYFQREGRSLHFFLDERTGTHYANDVTLSAREGIGLIEQLYFDKNYPSYQRVIDDMSRSTWGSFCRGGIPVPVSSKYGNLGSLNHEIGLVWTNKPFAYAVFSNGIPAYDVLPELGALLYNYHEGIIQAPATEPSSADQAEQVPEAENPYAPTAPSAPEEP